jgi:hypothetical protein
VLEIAAVSASAAVFPKERFFRPFDNRKSMMAEKL